MHFFPFVQEPFVELMKGSLNTFLNAFTYPDRTCYPVASTNQAVRAWMLDGLSSYPDSTLNQSMKIPHMCIVNVQGASYPGLKWPQRPQTTP